MMGQIYGHRWSSSFGEEDTGNVWLAGLKGVSHSALRLGLSLCVTLNSEWPPTLPEFRAMCIEKTTRNDKGHGAYNGAHRLVRPALPVPAEIIKQRKALGREKMSSLLGMMRGPQTHG